MKDSVGVIGGLGPLATSYFMNLVINNTKASKDQEHINMIVFNHSTTYDRTDYIIGKSDNNPIYTLIEDAKTLESLGCSFLVMPCNTAHYFYDNIMKNINIPFLNIVTCAIEEIKDNKKVKIGIMATDGTIKAKTYQDAIEKYGFEYFIPNQINQEKIMDYIYNYVKKGKTVIKEEFMKTIDYFFSNNCDYIIVGCTELSVIYTDLKITDKRIIDSLTVLAKKTIIKCGKELV